MMNFKGMIDENTLARDCAKRVGWPNMYGMHVASPRDIAKALLAFHRECEEAKTSALPQPAVMQVAAAIRIAMGDFKLFNEEGCEILARAALAGMPKPAEMSKKNAVEIIAEAALRSKWHVDTSWERAADSTSIGAEGFREAATAAYCAIYAAGYRIVKGTTNE